MKKLSKILTWIALAVGVVALILVGMMWGQGDDAIAASQELQNSTIAPLFAITWALFGIAAGAIVFFVLRTWVKNPKSLLVALPYIIGFIVVLGVAYLLTDSNPTLLSNGKYSTESDSFIADYGIWVTYILGAITVLCVAFGGFLKSLKK